MGTTKKFWTGIPELTESAEALKAQQNEFVEPIPVEDFLGNDSIAETSHNRRDFLKYLGFSASAAALAACETPVTKAIPYVIKPEEITPGVANWYASSYFDGQDYASILVKTREGRPIKIEGNTLSTITKGGTNARIQAAVLSLYDSSRLTGPLAGPGAEKAPTKWEQVDGDILKALNEIGASEGKGVRILTSTIISPSIKKAIDEFTAKYPNTKHVTYDAVSNSGMLEANATSFGKAHLPSYHFDKAKVIVSVGCDFLGNWISPVEFAKQYSVNRKVSSDKREMSKHYQFESIMSLTGANADIRVPVKVSQQTQVVLGLYNEIAKSTGAEAVTAASVEKADEKIKEAAKMLLDNKGKSLVVCGSNDTGVQVIVNAINTLLGNYGNTINMEVPCMLRQGNDKAFLEMIKEMGEGKVNALFTYNCNPVYTASGLGFTEAYSKVTLKVSFADRVDETAAMADVVCPDNHVFESWGDASAYKGNYNLIQPVISPLFSQPRHEGTRSFLDSILKWSGSSDNSLSYIKKYWADHVFPMQGKYMTFSEFWNYSLHDGVVEVGMGDGHHEEKKEDKKADKKYKKAEKKEEAKEEKMTAAFDWKEGKVAASIVSAAAATAAKSTASGEMEVELYQKVSMGNGNQANNPWLLEMPDPITKITWDNYVTMSPADMQGKYKGMERQDRMASLVTVAINGKEIGKLPVVPQPGQAVGTIGIALGYGRTRAGKLSANDKVGVVGADAYPGLQVINGNISYATASVTLTATGEDYEIAGTQLHHTIMDRESVIKTTTLDEYKKDPAAGNTTEMIMTNSGAKRPTEITLWDEHDHLGNHWGLTIDLNSCIGCGNCVVSCSAENNVAVVGKDQVKRTREMHWIRIDRYYESDMNKGKAEEAHVGAIDMYLQMENPSIESPRVVFQPVMCQHCKHAPCETVCPVLATNHSTEGMNMMTYNRCVGTRYCANNCPFKVRRFNWYNLNNNPAFGFNPTQDELGRMVLNPDVVVRSRGVMEKCSMCIQRVQEGKLNAKKAGRSIKDGDINTACAQSCPTNAITFGDINNAETEISKLRKEERNYVMLEEIGVQPGVSYLTKVRNAETSGFYHEPHRAVGHHGKHEEGAHEAHEGAEHKEEATKEEHSH